MPPILDYSWYETFREDGRELIAKEGRKDVGWITISAHIMIEHELLNLYQMWAVPSVNGMRDPHNLYAFKS